MEISWGDRLGDESQGLDILGIRGLDQSLETALANGITTISVRGRYFTILPWLIGEFFDAEKEAGATDFDGDRWRSFVGRVEYLTLACTTLDRAGGNSSGALGSDLYREEMGALRAGNPIPFPADRGGSLVGTYFGPCRTIGLVKSAGAGEVQPFSLTPRGQQVWTERRTAIGDIPLRSLLRDSQSLDPDQVRSVVPHFSLMGLTAAKAEAACLRQAIETPWVPAGGGTAVDVGYARFAGTLAWLRAQAVSGPLHAERLLAENYARAAQANDDLQEAPIAWAEFEWRRRLHFALELLFSALCETLRGGTRATVSEIVTEWQAEPAMPSLLVGLWPKAPTVWERSCAEAASSVPQDILIDPADQSTSGKLVTLSPHARALGAFALIAGLAAQSRELRGSGLFPDRGRLGGEALALVEVKTSESFTRLLARLAALTAEAHLQTTFRKMANGQKCSLRFFPDGPRLRTTGLVTGAGQSGSRLRNIIRILVDANVDGVAEAA